MLNQLDQVHQSNFIVNSVLEDFSNSRSTMACKLGERINVTAGVLSVEYNEHYGIAQYSITLQDVEVNWVQASGALTRIHYQHLHLFVPINEEMTIFAMNQRRQVAFTGKVYRYHRGARQMGFDPTPYAFSVEDIHDLKIIDSQMLA